MKIHYDPEVDTIRILLSSTPVASSHETKPDMIFDYDKDGNVVSMKIRNASERVENLCAVEYSITVPQIERTPSNSTLEQQPFSLSDRRAFLQLPLEERRRILAQQAEAMVEHYQKDSEAMTSFRNNDARNCRCCCCKISHLRDRLFKNAIALTSLG